MHDFGEVQRKLEVLEARNFIGDHAHHDGVTSTLPENIDAESADRRDGVSEVGGAFFFQLLPSVTEGSDQIVGDLAGMLRREPLEPLKFQFHQLAAALDLWGVTRGENQIAHLLATFQHCGNELRRGYGGCGRFTFRWGGYWLLRRRDS